MEEVKVKMTKKEFWFRFAIYILTALILPFSFLCWRFGLFDNNPKSFSGWGILGIFFIAIFFIKTLNSVRRGMHYCLAKQCIDGVCRVIIPLILGAMCCYYLQDVMDELAQFLCVLIVCESIAIVVNPIPRWEVENNIEHVENRLKKFIESLDIFNKKN